MSRASRRNRRNRDRSWRDVPAMPDYVPVPAAGADGLLDMSVDVMEEIAQGVVSFTDEVGEKSGREFFWSPTDTPGGNLLLVGFTTASDEAEAHGVCRSLSYTFNGTAPERAEFKDEENGKVVPCYTTMTPCEPERAVPEVAGW